jgi:glutamine---fructose-6-phosphate transaminase (isomerizing)
MNEHEGVSMIESAGLTRAEILTQPEAWRETIARCREAMGDLEALWRQERPDAVVFTGCGSTYYAAMFAAAALRMTAGADARACPASDLLLYPEMCYPREGRVMLVAISRSGSTSETVRACRDFLAAGRGPLVTISGYPEEPMGTMGDLRLIVPAAQEESVVQTRAFTALTIAALAAVAGWAGDERVLADLDLLPGACSQVLDHYLPAAAALGRREIDRVFILGSGPHYAIACEAGLKTKEVTLTPAEPFHFMEFRHGPKSLVTPDSLVIGLRSGEHETMERPVLAEMAALGGQVIEFAPRDADIAYDPESRIGELARAVLPLPALQWFATERALAQGFDPDRPRNLTQVITLDLG